MAEGSLGSVYYPLVTAFPWLLAALILATGRLTAPRAGVALVLVASGVETLHATSVIYGWGWTVDEVAVDGLLGMTLAFLTAQYPSALGGARGARWATVAWLVAMAGLLVAGGVRELHATPWLRQILHDGAFLMAGALLATHTVPRVLALAPGPLRAQAILVAAGIGMALLRVETLLGVEAMEHLVQLPGVRFDAGLVVLIAVWMAMGYFALAAVGQAAAGAARQPARDASALAVALGVGALVGILDQGYLGDLGGVIARPSQEFLSQALRPLLLAVAAVQYDLFEVPRWLRRPTLLAAAGMFAVALFTMLVAALSGNGFLSTDLNPAAATGALVVLLGLMHAVRGPMAEVLDTGDEGSGLRAERRARLERYRLALEDAQQRSKAEGGAGATGRAHDLEALRHKLGISRQEHATLAAVVEGNLVIPTVALVGASPGTVVQGRYEVLRELGRGGQGRVLLARDRIDGDEVVLKEVLRPWEDRADEHRLALQREAALVAGLASQHLPRVHGIVTEPWQTYLVREYVPGSDLEDLVAAQGPLPAERAARLLDDALEGLATLHAAGVLHLDVKPANVVARPDGAAVLIDHGTARRLARPGTEAAPGTEPAAAITVLYAAPEQLTGAAVDARTDVYQAGGLLYFLLTGRPPIEAEPWAEAGRRAAAAQPLAWGSARQAPAALRAIADRARAADPSLRYPDAEAMRDALRSAVLLPGAAAAG